MIVKIFMMFKAVFMLVINRKFVKQRYLSAKS